MLSAIAAKKRVYNANCGTGRRRSHAPTADGSTADGTRRSTRYTQKMGESAAAGTGVHYVKPWPRLLPQGSPLQLQLPWPWDGRWSTVAVEYHYSDQRTAHCENERSRELAKWN